MTRPTKFTLWKGGRTVATAYRMREAVLRDVVVEVMNLFFFPAIELPPPVLFEHLAGKALAAFLNGCGLEANGETYEPLRYVHGRTETMRGTNKISSVLLAKLPPLEQVDEALWLSNLPTIYTRFLALSD